MAVAVVVDSALRLKLDEILTPRTFVRLFRNDVPILADSVLLDFEPATFPGYADVELTSLWPAAVTPVEGQALSGQIPLLWTRGAGGTEEIIYGWVIYQDVAPDSVLLAGRRPDVPWPMFVEGMTVSFNLAAYLLRGF